MAKIEDLSTLGFFIQDLSKQKRLTPKEVRQVDKSFSKLVQFLGHGHPSNVFMIQDLENLLVLTSGIITTDIPGTKVPRISHAEFQVILPIYNKLRSFVNNHYRQYANQAAIA